MKTMIMVAVLALSSNIFAQNTASESSFGVFFNINTLKSTQEVSVAGTSIAKKQVKGKNTRSGAAYAAAISALPYELAITIVGDTFVASRSEATQENDMVRAPVQMKASDGFNAGVYGLDYAQTLSSLPLELAREIGNNSTSTKKTKKHKHM
ncbi:MAG: hypothetical protein ACRC9L_06405 [Brevinema sp.]